MSNFTFFWFNEQKIFPCTHSSIAIISFQNLFKLKRYNQLRSICHTTLQVTHEYDSISCCKHFYETSPSFIAIIESFHTHSTTVKINLPIKKYKFIFLLNGKIGKKSFPGDFFFVFYSILKCFNLRMRRKNRCDDEAFYMMKQGRNF